MSNMWSSLYAFVLLFSFTTNSGVSTHSSPLESTYGNSTVSGITYHRLIKRFAPKFSIPKPRLPTLPRPSLPFPIFSSELPKGDDGPIPIPKRSRNRPTQSSPKSQETPGDPHEDRTLIAAKKAMLFKAALLGKKVIVYKAFKKKKKKLKKKAAILYGLHKLSKAKGVTIKAPFVSVSVGSKKGKGSGAKEEEEASASVDEEEEAISALSGNDPDDNDNDGDDDNDDDDKPQTSSYSQESQLQQQQALMLQQLQQQQQTNSMMQQLQQQLIEQQKQQEMLNAQQQQPQQQPQPQLLAQTSQQAVIVTPQQPPALPPPAPLPLETYAAKKKGKKKKKKKKKSTPRPVNLGVKANLYNNFDKFTKKASHKVGSFIHIDIDFFRSGLSGHRRALDDLVQSPEKFFSRRARISDVSTEEFLRGIELPGNFFPAWHPHQWRDAYTNDKNECEEGKGTCKLSPIYVLFTNEMLN